MSCAVESDKGGCFFVGTLETKNVFVETPLLRATVHVHVRLHCTQLLSLSLSLFSWPSLRDFRVVLVDEEPFQDLDALSEEFV